MGIVVDGDTHVLPRDSFDDEDAERRFGGRWPRFARDAAGRVLLDFPERWRELTPLQLTMLGNHHLRGQVHPGHMHPGEMDSEVRVKWLDQVGIDMQVLVPQPAPFAYATEPELGLALCRSYNNAIGRLLKRHPGRFIGLAVVPLQDPPAAVEEVSRAIEVLGLHAPVIFSNVRGRNLDEPSLWPFYARVEQLGVPLIIHPHRFDNLIGLDRLDSMHLDNALGFMYEGMLAMAVLILKGVLDLYPRLRVALLETGADFLPLLMDRLEEIYENQTVGGVNPYSLASMPVKELIRKPPAQYLHQFWFSFNAVFETPTLPPLIRRYGPERFFANSDFPHGAGGAGDRMPEIVRSLPDLTGEQADWLIGRSACGLFGIDPVTRLQVRNGAAVAAAR